MKQQGAALVIVLSLLAGSSMIGVSGMNSALIDERLAGNYRASVQAQMNAEKAAALGLSARKSDSWDSAPEFSREQLSDLIYADVGDNDFLNPACINDEKNNRCAYGYVTIDGNQHVFALGEVYGDSGVSIANNFPIFVKFESQENSKESLPDDLENLKNIFGDINNDDNKKDFGMLAGKDIDIDNDNGYFYFKGNLYSGRSFETNENFSFDSEEYSDDEEENVPDVLFKEIISNIKNKEMTKDSARNYSGNCELNNPSESERGRCTDEDGIDFDEVINFSNTTIISEKEIEFGDGSIFENVTIISDKEIEFGDGSIFENVTIISDKEIEFGDSSIFENVTIISEKDIKFSEESSFENSSIIADRDIDFGDDSEFKNSDIVARRDVELGDALMVFDVSMLAGRDIEVEVKSSEDVSGWFYSGRDIEIEIEEANRFDGSLVAKRNIEFETETEEDFTFNHKPTDNFLDFLREDGGTEGGGGENEGENERFLPVSWGT